MQHPRFTAAAALCALLVATPIATRAEEPAAEPTAAQPPPPPTAPPPDAAPPPGVPTPGRRALAAGAALLPGLALHGSGHFVLGERETARRLLVAEGVGLGAFVTGLGALAVTGASRKTTAFVIPVAAGGAGLFVASAAADLYGVLAGHRAVAPPPPLPRLEFELGARWVHDPVFDYGAFAVAALDARRGRFRMSPSAWIATDDSNRRLRLEGAFRFAGSNTGGGDGKAGARSFADLVAAGTYHRYGTERFSISSGEVAIAARGALDRFGTTLAGSFVEGSLGYAAGAHSYDGIGRDATDMLLAGFGWGFRFGRIERTYGEARLYYDHRHDGYAAGLKTPGLGSGPMGHVGTDVRVKFPGRFGLRAEVEAGSAWVAGLSLLVRMGGDS